MKGIILQLFKSMHNTKNSDYNKIIKDNHNHFFNSNKHINKPNNTHNNKNMHNHQHKKI